MVAAIGRPTHPGAFSLGATPQGPCRGGLLHTTGGVTAWFDRLRPFDKLRVSGWGPARLRPARGRR